MERHKRAPSALFKVRYTLPWWLAETYNLIFDFRAYTTTWGHLSRPCHDGKLVIWPSHPTRLGLMLVDHCVADFFDNMAAQVPEEVHLRNYHGR
jgi:hypothetical protein